MPGSLSDERSRICTEAELPREHRTTPRNAKGRILKLRRIEVGWDHAPLRGGLQLLQPVKVERDDRAVFGDMG